MLLKPDATDYNAKTIYLKGWTSFKNDMIINSISDSGMLKSCLMYTQHTLQEIINVKLNPTKVFPEY